MNPWSVSASLTLCTVTSVERLEMFTSHNATGNGAIVLYDFSLYIHNLEVSHEFA